MSLMAIMYGYDGTCSRNTRFTHFLPMKFQKKNQEKFSLGELVDFEWTYHESMWNNTNKCFLEFLGVLVMQNDVESIENMYFHPYARIKHTLNTKDEIEKTSFMHVERFSRVLVMVLVCGWRHFEVLVLFSTKVQILVVRMMVRKMCWRKSWFYAWTWILCKLRTFYIVHVGVRNG